MIDWSQPRPLSKVTEDAGFTMSDVAFVSGLDESTVSRLWDDPRWLDRVSGRSLQSLAASVPNTRDFRCLWRSGLLPLSCSVSVFESGCVVPPRERGHDFGPRVAAGTARGSTVRGPGGRGGFSFPAVPASAAGYEKPGANTVTC